MEAAEAACGDAGAWITTMIELIMVDLERDIAQRGGLSFELAEILPRSSKRYEQYLKASGTGKFPRKFQRSVITVGTPL